MDARTGLAVRPVAVVALGDSGMADDGVALRVMGRVRPLLAEIAMTAARAKTGKGGPPRRLSDLVDWIEGTHWIDPLRPSLIDRQRVVLIDAITRGVSPGTVMHWHLDRRRRSDLSVVRFYRTPTEGELEHLGFWLEDDLPEHGTDLIAIEPHRVEPGSELSPVLRSRLASITSQVGGILMRIFEEEGWRTPPPRRPRVGRGKPTGESRSSPAR